MHGRDENCKVLVRKPEGKRPFGRPSLREKGWEDVEWTHVAQDKGPLVGSCEHHTVVNLWVL